MVAGWAGAAQFGAHVGAAFKNAPMGALPPGFAEDRKRRFVGFDFDAMPTFAPHLETQVLGSAQWIESLLADGRSFIGGDAPGHGDLALYSNLWFLTAMPFATEFAASVMSRPRLASWFARIAAIGHGHSSEISGADAIAAARDASPAPATGNVEGWPQEQPVMIRTEQSGDDPVRGSLLRCDCGGITVRRVSDKVGEVNVHFPRLGQIVVPA
jgi:glutathione S-transferase